MKLISRPKIDGSRTILDILKKIKKLAIRTFKKKMPSFFLPVYYFVKVYFLKIDKDLKEMVFDFLKNDYHKVSKLWFYLMFHHLKSIEIYGNDFEKLNKYIFRNYCLRFNKKKHLEKLYEIYPEKRLINLNNLNEQEIYIETSKLMMNLLKNKNFEFEHKKLDFRDINIQDKIQSAIELEYIKEYLNFNSLECIFEIGAGYGRIPELLLQTNSLKKYFIVDIPPALFLSYKYLQQKYHNIKIYKYSNNLNLNNFEEIFKHNNIFFISPVQLNLIINFFKNKNNLIIAINCLQEFPEKTIIDMFKNFSYIANYAYIKSQIEPSNPWNDKLLSFDQILKKINWKVVNNQIVKFPDNYKECILTKNF